MRNRWYLRIAELEGPFDNTTKPAVLQKTVVCPRTDVSHLLGKDVKHHDRLATYLSGSEARLYFESVTDCDSPHTDRFLRYEPVELGARQHGGLGHVVLQRCCQNVCEVFEVVQ